MDIENEDKMKQIVKDGYNIMAESHSKLTDKEVTQTSIFKEFVNLIKEKNVLELGVGSGSPVSSYFIERDYNYIGIDISESQIKLSQQDNPGNEHRFIEDDMLNYCKKCKDESVGGILAFFSIFHLPRKFHVVLFDEIKRILMKDAPIIFTSGDRNWTGVENFVDSTPMYWSNFSYKWYEQTLLELGFEYKMIFKRNKWFFEAKEIQYFLLFTKI